MPRTHHRAAPALLALLALLAAAALSLPGRAAAPPTQTFDITVSLEWEPGKQDTPASSLPAALAATGCAADAEATYLADLQAGLQEASRYLYAYSRGRFALGSVTIDTEGRQWGTADIRILADGAHRPTAEVGGIVAAPTPNASAATGVSVTFYPGSVTLGRFWDGRGARCGAWSQPEAWRTIGHEWAHYALFLWDEYYEEFTLREEYCTTSGLPRLDRRRGERAPAAVDGAFNSVMAYHYTADRLWESGMPAACERTPQRRVHGVSDWEAIKRFYPAIGSPDELPPGPAPAPTFVIAAPAPSEHTTALVKAEGFPAPRGVARAYLVRGLAGGQPARIIGQGELLQGETATLLGARPSQGDSTLIGLEDWAGGGRYSFPATSGGAGALDTAPGAPAAALALAPSLWRPALQITPLVKQLSPTTSQLTGLRLRIEDCSRRTKQVQVVLCPAGGLCDNALVLVASPQGLFTAEISLPDEIATRQAASRGYIYLRSLDTNEEAISTYQVGGGAGSGHIGAHPPLLDATAMVETPAGQDPPTGQDMRVLTSTALTCQVPPLPAGIFALAGNPVDVQPAFADQGSGRPWGSLPGDPPLAVRLSYSQDLIDRLGIDEHSLVLLRINGQGLWERVPEAGRSADMDWVAGTPQALGGQGAVYALGYAETRVALPLVVDGG